MDTVKKAVQGRSDKVSEVVDKTKDKVNRRTDGKYADKLAAGADKVKDAARRLDPQDGSDSRVASGGDPTAVPGTSSTPDARDTSESHADGPIAMGHKPGPPALDTEDSNEGPTTPGGI